MPTHFDPSNPARRFHTAPQQQAEPEDIGLATELPSQGDTFAAVATEASQPFSPVPNSLAFILPSGAMSTSFAAMRFGSMDSQPPPAPAIGWGGLELPTLAVPSADWFHPASLAGQFPYALSTSENELAVDLAYETAHRHLTDHCRKTLQAFATKMKEIHARPWAGESSAEQPFHAGDLEQSDGRLITTLPALVLAASIPQMLQDPLGMTGLELYDEERNTSDFGEIREKAAQELKSGTPMPQLLAQIATSLETKVWPSDTIRSICLALHRVAAKDAGNLEGKFRNTVAYQIAWQSCQESDWQ